jgi:hypothetical protein
MNPEIIAAFLTGILGPLLLYFITYYLDKKKRQASDPISESVVSSDMVHAELSYILHHFNADRVWIAQFHNGAYYYPTGKSVRKFTIFHEVAVDSVSRIAGIFKDIPCSLYSRSLSSILTTRGIFIPSFTNPAIETYALDNLAETGGTKSSFILPLYSLDEKAIGFMTIDWVKEAKDELNHEEHDEINQRAYRIAGYLSNYLSER